MRLCTETVNITGNLIIINHFKHLFLHSINKKLVCVTKAMVSPMATFGLCASWGGSIVMRREEQMSPAWDAIWLECLAKVDPLDGQSHVRWSALQLPSPHVDSWWALCCLHWWGIKRHCTRPGDAVDRIMSPFLCLVMQHYPFHMPLGGQSCSNWTPLQQWGPSWHFWQTSRGHIQLLCRRWDPLIWRQKFVTQSFCEQVADRGLNKVTYSFSLWQGLCIHRCCQRHLQTSGCKLSQTGPVRTHQPLCLWMLQEPVLSVSSPLSCKCVAGRNWCGRNVLKCSVLQSQNWLTIISWKAFVSYAAL